MAWALLILLGGHYAVVGVGVIWDAGPTAIGWWVTGDLDPIIHAPIRLKIAVTLSALGDGDSLTFARLQGLLRLTPGNLITHLRKLEVGGYLVTEKSENRKERSTSVRLTPAGRQALAQHTRTLRALLDPVSTS